VVGGDTFIGLTSVLDLQVDCILMVQLDLDKKLAYQSVSSLF